jgi:hypothetical protein
MFLCLNCKISLKISRLKLCGNVFLDSLSQSHKNPIYNLDKVLSINCNKTDSLNRPQVTFTLGQEYETDPGTDKKTKVRGQTLSQKH